MTSSSLTSSSSLEAPASLAHHSVHDGFCLRVSAVYFGIFPKGLHHCTQGRSMSCSMKWVMPGGLPPPPPCHCQALAHHAPAQSGSR